ncbi:UNVERIFIED_CONTAM: hypothetical protein Sradi_6876600 [Sesamum radiatum]|uniref:Uncharacterized protein n=1 Tax=Sesamum radiatum TaxID=300843 RepID=A0AAW2JLW9_SESRA
MKYTSSAVKESGVASFEYLETDGYVKGSALASLVSFLGRGSILSRVHHLKEFSSVYEGML